MHACCLCRTTQTGYRRPQRVNGTQQNKTRRNKSIYRGSSLDRQSRRDLRRHHLHCFTYVLIACTAKPSLMSPTRQPLSTRYRHGHHYRFMFPLAGAAADTLTVNNKVTAERETLKIRSSPRSGPPHAKLAAVPQQQQQRPNGGRGKKVARRLGSKREIKTDERFANSPPPPQSKITQRGRNGSQKDRQRQRPQS